MKWSELSPMQLGQYGEYWAKMEFTSYGFEVYTSEVDDYGVDFIVKNRKDEKFFEVQVKSIFKGNYVFIPKSKIKIDDSHLVCLLKFSENALPDVYVIPATVWNNPNGVFVERNYDKPNQKSKPEWGISVTKANLQLLEPYRIEKFVL